MKKLLLIGLVSWILASCTTTPEKVTSKLKVYPAPLAAQFPDASLKLDSLSISKSDSGADLQFNFLVEGYELGTQTPDAETRGIANSEHGQHIHYIVNNEPYSAHYPSSFTSKLPNGSYVLLAFLSRSYHESIKNPSAFWIDTLSVNSSEKLEIDLSAPHMFFSRPKGTYKGNETEKLMIDFYLLNTTLSPDGNKVKATIQGEEFLFDQWTAYFVEGLPKGEITLSLELIDASGNNIPGPYNKVTRKVTLSE